VVFAAGVLGCKFSGLRSVYAGGLYAGQGA
jgi:hypothetical protein